MQESFTCNTAWMKEIRSNACLCGVRISVVALFSLCHVGITVIYKKMISIFYSGLFISSEEGFPCSFNLPFQHGYTDNTVYIKIGNCSDGAHCSCVIHAM